MANSSYEVNIRGNTNVYRAEFGKAISSNDKFGKSLTGLSQGATAVQGPMGGVASRISVLNSLFSSGNLVLTGFAAGMAVLTAGTYKSLKVFDEYQRGQLKTEALLKATGNAAGFTAQQLENQASSVALNTLASVGGIVEAQNVLQTFKTVSGDTFTQAIELSQDMAATMGGTAKDKALQLGKALENPTEGLTALNKTGLTFTKSERDMVKAMQDAGDMADAQSFILRKLRDQVGGTGSAEAGGLSGDVDTMSQRWDELLNSFAKTTGSAGIASSWIQNISGALKGLREAIDPTVSELENKLAKLQAEPLADDATKIKKDARKSEVDSLKVQILEAKAANDDMDAISQLITQRAEKIAEVEEKIANAGAPNVSAPNDRSAGKYSKKLGVNVTPTKGRAERAFNVSDTDKFEKEKEALEQERLAFQEHYAALEAAEKQHKETQTALKQQAAAEAATVAAEEEEKEKAKQDRIAEANAREVESVTNKFASIHEAALAAEEMDVELENVRYERKVSELAREMELLTEKGLVTTELELAHKAALEDLEREHQANLGEIKAEADEKTLQAEKEKNDKIAAGYGYLSDAVGSYFDGMQGKQAGYARAAISIGKTLLDSKKRDALQSIWTNTADASMGAYNAMASIPYIGPVLGGIAAAAVMLAGGVAAAKVTGMAHSGMTNIPREGTYLLSGGERVVQPEQNKDLGRFLKAADMQNSVTENRTINENYIKAWDAQSVRDMLVSQGAAIDESLTSFERE
jgi:hypothetical protein